MVNTKLPLSWNLDRCSSVLYQLRSPVWSITAAPSCNSIELKQKHQFDYWLAWRESSLFAKRVNVIHHIVPLLNIFLVASNGKSLSYALESGVKAFQFFTPHFFRAGSFPFFSSFQPDCLSSAGSEKLHLSFFHSFIFLLRGLFSSKHCIHVLEPSVV